MVSNSGKSFISRNGRIKLSPKIPKIQPNKANEHSVMGNNFFGSVMGPDLLTNLMAVPAIDYIEYRIEYR